MRTAYCGEITGGNDSLQKSSSEAQAWYLPCQRGAVVDRGTQNPAVGLRICNSPAVSAKSKSADRQVLRRRQLPSQRTFRNTTPELVTTTADTRDLRLSAAAESATSPYHPPATSRSSIPPQLSPFSDSHIAPGYHPFGPLRMSQNTQLRPLSSFDKNEI